MKGETDEVAVADQTPAVESREAIIQNLLTKVRKARELVVNCIKQRELGMDESNHLLRSLTISVKEFRNGTDLFTLLPYVLNHNDAELTDPESYPERAISSAERGVQESKWWMEKIELYITDIPIFLDIVHGLFDFAESNTEARQTLLELFRSKGFSVPEASNFREIYPRLKEFVLEYMEPSRRENDARYHEATLQLTKNKQFLEIAKPVNDAILAIARSGLGTEDKQKLLFALISIEESRWPADFSEFVAANREWLTEYVQQNAATPIAPETTSVE